MGKTDRESASLEAETAPSLDLVFDILADRRRRYALYYLSEQDEGVATTEELVSSICNRETDGDESTDHREQIQTSLHHVHLPRLEDAGIVEYDSRSSTVRYWSQPTIDEWVEHARHKERLG